jgi:hypothetical protein
MNHTTYYPPVHLKNFVIYPEYREIYAHNECELFSVQDLTIDDLNRLHSDLINELGQDRASEIMQQLTANK